SYPVAARACACARSLHGALPIYLGFRRRDATRASRRVRTRHGRLPRRPAPVHEGSAVLSRRPGEPRMSTITSTAQRTEPERSGPVLEGRHLVKEYPVGARAGLLRRQQTMRAVDDVSISLTSGRVTALVG